MKCVLAVHGMLCSRNPLEAYNMKIKVAAIVVLALLTSPAHLARASASTSAGGNGKLSSDEQKQVKALIGEFRAATDEAGRKAAFDKLIAMGKQVVTLVNTIIDNELKQQEKQYTQVLGPKIRAAYIKKLESITDDQLAHILRTRNLWKPYILNGGSHPKFREVYLAPIWKMKEILLLKISKIEDMQVVESRKKLVEFAGYQTQCHKILKINPDPTVGKMSPTNIEYAHLDQPPTFMDKLHHFERTLILIHTVASPGAAEVLLMTDQAAREIDVQEAEYVMAANEVRMLAGSIAWRADPLGCAVTRDHSTDRKEGRAKGHMSDVPGKRGFTDRNKRMGAVYYGSEGAGGGRNGPAYLNGLSYSGEGHGGPLYRLARNRVGVGRRGGVYTSQYGTDKQYIHPCPATEDEMWMPPGITGKDLRSSSVARVYRAIKSQAYGSALKAIEKVKSPTGVDAIAVRFFRVAIDVNIEQSVKEILATEQSGDVFYAKVLLNQAMAQCKGITSFEEKVAEVAERLTGEELRSEMRVGKSFYRLYFAVKDLPRDKFDANRRELIQRLNRIARSYKDSIYGKAAEDVARRLADPKSSADAFMAYFKERRESADTVAVD